MTTRKPAKKPEPSRPTDAEVEELAKCMYNKWFNGDEKCFSRRPWPCPVYGHRWLSQARAAIAHLAKNGRKK